MTTEILSRKGARKVNEVPEEVLEYLNQGVIETVNLTEWLALDQLELLAYNQKSLNLSKASLETIRENIGQLKKPTAMSRIKVIGATLYHEYCGTPKYEELIKRLANHTSDTIRCYATYLISLNNDLSIEERFDQSKFLVADHHFGVREVVWMALRPMIDEHLEKSIEFLSKWSLDEDENVRRFASEATRPRGVWCKHIDTLKETPQIALPLLDPLKSDPAKYVQDSVGNWLNDASKTQADFVVNVCERWMIESPTKETAKIIKRARRTIDKK